MILLYFGVGLTALGFIFKNDAEMLVSDLLPSEKFDALFKKYGALYGVDWKWLKAICMNESSLGTAKSVALGMREPNNVEGSKSSDGKSWGIMQVTLTTARDMDSTATEAKLNNPEYSVNLAAKYLKTLKTQFPITDNRYVEWVIKSYNQGPGNSKKERLGTSAGFAHEYWARFKRNLERIG